MLVISRVDFKEKFEILQKNQLQMQKFIELSQIPQIHTQIPLRFNNSKLNKIQKHLFHHHAPSCMTKNSFLLFFCKNILIN